MNMKQSSLSVGKGGIRTKLILFTTFQMVVVFLCLVYVFYWNDVPLNRTAGIVMSIGYILLTSIGVYWIISDFQRGLRSVLSNLNELVAGNTSVRTVLTANEFGILNHAINDLADNLNRASAFAKKIGEGNADVDFKLLSNADVLGTALLNMRDTLATIREADMKRNWVAEGLALFADFIRKSNDLHVLSDTLIRELVKYTKSTQGGLFIVDQRNKQDVYLELVACYAYERKKFLDKRIGVGQGLLGQCYLEGQPLFLTQVPQDYVNITSGLGSANPSCVLIVPLKVNDITEGVIELASFEKFETHEIEFVQKAGEIIASAISNARVNTRTKEMLSESQQQSEEMRAQEEEMRQNMEEMQATQEAMHRQAMEMKKMQSVLELEKSMFNVLMEVLPDRITYKDTESRILRINQAKAQRLNMTPDEVVGKTDYDFFSAEHAEKAMREEKALINSGKPLMDIEEKLRFNNGDTAWVSTSRIPFKNEENQVTGMFIITKDITKLKAAEFSIRDRDRIIMQLMDEVPLLHYKVDRNGIITEMMAGEKIKSTFSNTSDILSRKLHDVFPKVNNCITQKNGTHFHLSCIDGTVSNGIPILFKHNIFADSIHEGMYWVYALKIDS
jgi:methyl-accepting chemotaxis protein